MISWLFKHLQCIISIQSHPKFLNILRSQIVEIWVFQCFFHRNTTSWIQLKHLHHQIKTILVKVFEMHLRIHTLEFWESWFEIREIVWITSNLRILVHWEGEGVPWNWNILKIWSISLSPQKSGFFYVSSANIQPTAQISTPRLYCFWPSKTSGALYQRVSI